MISPKATDFYVLYCIAIHPKKFFPPDNSKPANDTNIQPADIGIDEEEPIDNTGLTKTPYGDGYYTICSGGRYSYAPNVTATLSRKYTTQNLGLTKYYKFSAGETLSQIIVKIGKSESFLDLVIKLLTFLPNQILSYATAVECYTYRYTYNYKVRVNNAGNNVYFEPKRIKDYWKVYNITDGKEGRELKSDVGGYPPNNMEAIRIGISNYLTYQFYDIVNHWGKEHIKWAYEKGYVAGTGTYAFSPEGTTTRAMAISVIYRMAGSPSAETSTPFTDVPSSSYYAKAVSWGVKNKIVAGTSSTQFSPNSAVTKEQFITMLYNYAKYKGKNVSASANLIQFSDGSSVSNFAQNAMKWAVAKKIIVGDNGYLKPKKNSTRAELCVMIHSYSEKA